MSDARALQIDEWSRNNRIRCIYFLARVDDPASVRAAEKHGFLLVDIRLTFQRKLDLAEPLTGAGQTEAYGIRTVRKDDLSELQAIAVKAHTNTRFFSDVLFPRERAEALYSTWIALECQGRAQKVLVSVSAADRPLGYITCRSDSKRREGQIGLLGVTNEVRRQGIGNSLVLAALHWLSRQGVQTVSVVTQGRNPSALRLYERCGFLVRDLQFWYHKWYPTTENNRT